MEKTNVVQVQFGRSKIAMGYSYFVDQEVKIGQPVVVRASGEYKIVTVSKIDLTEEETARAEAWIVQVIDEEAHIERVKRGPVR